MHTHELLAEMRAARLQLSAVHRARVIDAGVPSDIVQLYPLIGFDLVLIKGNRYRPDPQGLPAFITPVLVGNVWSPECSAPLVHARHLGDCIDLVAWHPAHPSRWALRNENATWLGCIGPQYCNPDPVCVRRSPLSWLQAACDGLVILSSNPAVAYGLISGCREIIAEDDEHANELRKITRRPWPLPRIGVFHAA